MSATPSSNLGFQNFFSATLTGDITATSTDILLDNIPNSTEGFLVIDPDSTTSREVIFYTSKTALKVVCPSVADGRGQDDTTAASHTTGTTVIIAPIAAYFEALQSGLSLGSGVITYAKLLSTIFSGQIQTQANSGTAGGTLSYINLGGLKLMWCQSASGLTSGSSSLAYSFIPPVGFFTSVTGCIATCIGMTGQANQFASIQGAPTTSITQIYVTSPGGAATTGISIIQIGT